MLLPALELLERVEIGVAIAQPDDEAQRHLPIVLMVEEAAAISVRQRPPLGMNDEARLVLGGIDVPQFLHAQAIDLLLAVGVERELALQYLGQMAARPLRKEGVAGMQFQPRLIVGLAIALPVDAHVAGRDALHRPVLLVEDRKSPRLHSSHSCASPMPSSG